MDIKIIGTNIELAKEIKSYAEEAISKLVSKYFKDAISADIRIGKTLHLFNASVIVNEGVRSKHLVAVGKSEAGDIFSAVNEALEKLSRQLKKHKERIKNYHHTGKEQNFDDVNIPINAQKYVVNLPSNYDIFKEFESQESEDFIKSNSSLNIINEKTTSIEELRVEDAIMKMDLQNLPALAFINQDTKRVNFIYYRHDGNISWIDPQS